MEINIKIDYVKMYFVFTMLCNFIIFMGYGNAVFDMDFSNIKLQTIILVLVFFITQITNIIMYVMLLFGDKK